MKTLFRLLVGGLTENKKLFIYLLLVISASGVSAQCPPVVTAFPVSASVCMGDSVQLAVAPSGAASYQWYQSGVPITGATHDTLYAKVDDFYTVLVSGCAIPSAPIHVAMKAMPTISITSNINPPIICAGDSITLTVNTGPQVMWVWLQPSGYLGMITNPLTVHPIIQTTFQLVGVNQLTGCANTSNFTVFIDYPIDGGIASANQAICAGSIPATITCTPASGGHGSFTYQWMYSNSTTGGSYNNIPGATASAYTPGPLFETTLYCRRAISPPCTPGLSIPVTITVNQHPIITSSAIRTVCTGTSVAYTPISDVAGTTFTWTGSVTSGVVSGLSASGTGNINDILDLPAGTITWGQVTYIITPTGPAPTFCSGTPKSVVINIAPRPILTNIVLTQTICAGGTTTPVVLTSNMPGSDFFVWTCSAPPGITGYLPSGTGNIPAQQIFSSLLAPALVTYMITPRLISGSGCAGTPVIYTVQVEPSPTVTNIPLAETICSGNTTTAVNLTSNVVGTSFSWTALASPASISGYAANGTSTIPAQTIINPSNVIGTVTYTITPSGSLGACPATNRDYVVTINPRPDAIPTPSNPSICSGAGSGIALSSSVAGTTFSWTATGDPSITGYSAGIGSSINQPLINSTYIPATATYTVTPRANGCDGTPIVIVVTVNPIPDITNSPMTGSTCSGNLFNVALTSHVAGTIFSWTVTSSAGVTGSSSGSGTTISQTLVNTGFLVQTVTYSITPSANGCNGIPTDYVVTVYPTPDLTTTPLSKTICSGTPINIPLTSDVSGTTFSWTASGPAFISGFSANSGNSIIANLINSGSTPGVVTYSITPSANGCPGATINYDVTVNPIPDISLSSNTQMICSGTASSPVTLTSFVTGTTFTWTASPSSLQVSGFIASGTGDIPSQLINSTLAITGTVTFTITPSANGCTGTPVTHIITINPLPAVTNGILAQAICSGSANAPVVLTSNVIGTTFSWTATASSPTITGYTASGVTTIPAQFLFNPGATPETVTYHIIPTSNMGMNCQGTPADYIVTVNPLPSITSSLSESICSESVFNYTITGNIAGSTFMWSRGFIPGIMNPPSSGNTPNITETLINTTAADINVTYQLTPYGTFPTLCPGSPATLDVTVRPLPAVNAGSDKFIPFGTSTSLNGTASGNALPLTYNWTPVGMIASGSTTLTPTTTNLSSNTTYTLVVTDATGCQKADQMQVIVTGSPLTVNPSATPSAICFGDSSLLTAVANGGSGAYFYTWTSVPAGFNSNLATEYVHPTVSTTYTISVFDGFNTVSATKNVTVNPLPLQYAVIGGGEYCIGGTGVDVSLALSETNVNYQLEFNGAPIGTPVTGTGATISFGNQTLSGIYTVTANNMVTGCTSAMSGSANITINPLPLANAGIDLTIPYGTNTLLSGSASGGTGALSYNWAPAASIASGISTLTPGTTNIYANTNFNFTVTDSKGCATVDQMTVSLSGSPLSVVATATPGMFCNDGTSSSLLATPSGGSGTYTFSWTCLPPGSPFWTSTLPNPSVTPTLTTIYTVVVDDGYNTASATVTVTVNPLPTAYSVTGGGAYCFGGAGVPLGLSGSDVGCTYQLLRAGMPDGPAITGTGAAISFGLKTAAFNYTVDASNTSTGCFRSMTGSVNVIITPLPLAYIVTGGGSYPAGGVGLPIGLSNSQIGVSYQLFIGGVPAGAPKIGTGAAISFGLQTIAGTYTVVATDPVTNCTNNMSGSASIIVNALPIVFDVIGGGDICLGDPGLSVGLNGSESGIDYQLLLNGSNVGAPIAGTGTSLNFGTFNTAGIYTAIGTVSSTGTSTPMNGSTFIIVNPLPAIYLLSPTGIHCPGTIVRLNSSQAGVNYTLYRNGVSIATLPGSGMAGLLDFGAQTIQGVYTISAINTTTGCQSNMIGSCTITTSPQIFTLVPVGSICAGDNIGLSGSEPGISYQLLLNGSINIGVPVAGTGAALNFGAQAITGNYTVIATNPATGCVSTMTGNVTVGAHPTANAGVDATICSAAFAQLTGVATNFSSVLWSTSGNGTFNDATLLNAQYTPGSNDIATGTATLTLTVFGTGGCISFPITDNVTLTIDRLPVAQAGPDGNVCSNGTFMLNGNAQHNTSVTWSTLGDGTFSNISVLNPIYFPGANDRLAGAARLILTAAGSLSCASSSSVDDLLLTIDPLPTVNAGPNASVCVNSPASLSGSVVNSSSVLWTTSGDGTFSNPFALAPQYFPGISDKAIGFVQLTLTANGTSTCNGSFRSNFMLLTINQPPTANAGIDATICASDDFTVTTATATNYTGILWTTSGNGTFSNPNAVLPTYFPSPADIASGSVVLTLTSFSASCAPVSDNMTLQFHPLPIVSAGNDDVICEGSPYTVNSATASNYSSLSWTSSGTGVILNGNTLAPTYTPGATDIANGSVTLTITATASAPCLGNISNTMTLIIKHNPLANAGNDVTLCENIPFTVNDASAVNSSSLLWVTTGTGLLANQNTLTPTYTPSAADAIAGIIQLTLVASDPPCSDNLDVKTLQINGAPVVSAGGDASTCATCIFNLTTATATNVSSILWTSSGSGTLTGANTITPSYVPSAYDISQGHVTLSIVCDGIAPCGQAFDDMLLTITNAPGVDFTAGAECIGQPVNFIVDPTNTDVNAVTNYLWDFGDGFFSPLMNPTHLFPAAGPYNVTLSIIDTSGYTNSTSHTISLTPLPVSFFAYSSPNCVNEPIRFTDLSHTLYGFIAQWVWEYGDGTPNDTINFPDQPDMAHLYSAPGTYNVTLYITNSFGCYAMSSQSVVITPKPYANFYFSGNCEDQIVTFTDASFPNGGGNVVAWAWDFGDPGSGIDNISNLTDPTHIYSTPGTYNVTLVITNFNNCNDTIVKAVTVNLPPIVDFGHGPSCLNTPTEFFADSLVMNVNAVADWFWNFGDGVSSTSQNTIHPFTSTGTFLVSLTITDTAGCTNTITHPVIINPLPVAHFDISDHNCSGQSVAFTNLATTTFGHIVKWNWNFGDGSDTTINFPSNPSVLHAYATGGNYIITLSVTASDSCTAFETQTLTIFDAPVADFDYDLSCFGTPVKFTDISQSNGGGMITGWFWNFGDPLSGTDNTSDFQNPEHLFHTPGLHTISLMVTTTNGCKGTVEYTINITPAPAVEFTSDHRCEGSPVQFHPDLTIINTPAIVSWLWNFGDGFTSSLQDAEHIYALAGTYPVTLTVTDTAGCSNSITHQVLIIARPVANFDYALPNCAGTPKVFTNNSVAPYGFIVNWQWNFGDGAGTSVNFPNNANVSHLYAAYGSYNVTLTVITNDSCSASITKTITVSPSPVANFSFISACATGSVSFNNQSQIGSTGIITDWFWNFGDAGSGMSNTSTMENPNHNYGTPGSYQVSLTVTSSTGCTNTISKAITIGTPPAVNFVSVPGCISDSTQFTSSIFVNAAALTTWLWEFGDGGTSSEIDPYHIYTLAGSYIVTLTVTDTAGCTNSVTHQALITPAPVAFYSYAAPSCSNYPVLFNDQSTSPNGQIITWHWDFGDGNDTIISSPANPDIAHTYTNAGIFNVTVEVTTSTGCENTYAQVVTITAGPLAGFSYEGACLNTPVQFADQTSINGGNSIVSWLWNFGDPVSGANNTSNLQNPAHIYSMPGMYTVNLLVTNANGCIDTNMMNVEVHPLPAVDFGFGAANCQGMTTLFFVDSLVTNLQSIRSFDWDFGDGTTHSSLQNPSHLYASSGNYVVILTVTDTSGCINFINKGFEVHPAPTAAFTFASSCLNTPAQFTDHSYTINGESISGWNWNFGDAGTSALQNPQHTYAAGGTYQVVLTVTSESGCTDSIQIPVNVTGLPTAQFGYTADPCANGAVYFQDSSLSTQSTIISWMWEFEPNHYSSLQNPTYVYHYADSCYSVNLTVTDILGCSHTTTQQVCVPAGLMLDLSATETCNGDPTVFTPEVLKPAGDSLVIFLWNFGEAGSGYNNTSTLREPSHLYSTPGTYIVSLQATDIHSCTSTKYKEVTVGSIPAPDFTFLGGNCDSTIFFKNTTNNNGSTISTWVWEFGDGTDTTIQSPASPNLSHLYPNPGAYKVTFTSISEHGCQASVSDTVRRFPCMISDFRAVDTLICQHSAITFADSSTCGGPIASWLWDFGDNSTSSYIAHQPNITHIYQNPGTYTVKLVITTQMVGGMSSDSSSRPVKVNPSPVAKFVAQDVCMGIPADFVNSTAGNGTQISGYLWSFGDPKTVLDTCSKKHPTYLYGSTGAFDAQLVATNTIGCSDTIIHTLTVHPLPTANFGYSNSCAGSKTHFTDASDTVNAPLTNWRWDFMDVSGPIGYSNAINPDFRFTESGDYMARLVIADANGCFDTLQKQVITHPVPVNACSITDNYENTQGQILLNNGTIDATRYEWDFGNGFTSSAQNPTVTYNKDGDYKIKLISWNDFQCSDTLNILYKLMFKGLYIPNAFSPNNPASDDLLFKPAGMNLRSYHISVYDSWGNKLWSSSKLDERGSPVESWDGTVQGNPLPQDVYIWKVEAIFNDGTIWNNNDVGEHNNLPEKTFGTVTLIR
jgi:gliding motility-associated-like protein